MQNVTPILVRKNDHDQEEASWSFPGGVIGFASYWAALVLPFLSYGANTLFFLLYTWPFFLALLPVSVITGIVVSLMMRGRLIYTLFITMATVFSLFGGVLYGLSGW